MFEAQYRKPRQAGESRKALGAGQQRVQDRAEVQGGRLASVDSTAVNGWSLGFSLRQAWRQWRGSERTVVAAVCYRVQPDGEIEFLLVRTRAGRWTFPKGGVDGDPSAAAAAAREAHEEAGVMGRVELRPFAGYLHAKGGRPVHSVSAHLCEVLHLEKPAESYRAPTWFSADKAKRRLRENRRDAYGIELERVVEGAVRRLTGKLRLN